MAKLIRDKENTKELKTFKQLRKRVYQRFFKKIVEEMPWRRKDIIARALMFCKQNKDVLVIIADPSKDDIIACYKNHYTAATISHHQLGGLIKTKQNIIKHLIQRDGTEEQNKHAVNNFLSFMDGYLYNLSKQINKVAGDSPSDNGEENNKDNLNGTNT